MWFSARAEYLFGLVDPAESRSYWYSTFLIEAPDFEGAFEESLKVAATREESYLNGDGETVAMRLVRISTLDSLGETLRSGREVAFDHTDGVNTPFEPEYHPERHQPDVSGLDLPESI